MNALKFIFFTDTTWSTIWKGSATKYLGRLTIGNILGKHLLKNISKGLGDGMVACGQPGRAGQNFCSQIVHQQTPTTTIKEKFVPRSVREYQPWPNVFIFNLLLWIQDFSAVVDKITVETAVTVKVGRFSQKTIFRQFYSIHNSVWGITQSPSSPVHLLAPKPMQPS